MAIYTESDLHTYSQNVTTVDCSLLTGSIDWRMDEVTMQHACPPFHTIFDGLSIALGD